MYEVKNIGKKLVHIGKKAIMPGDVTTINDTQAKSMAVQALCNHGLLSLTKKETAKAKAEEKVEKEPEDIPEEITVDEGEIAVENMTVAQLKSVASQMGIDTTGMKKAQIIEAIEASAED